MNPQRIFGVDGSMLNVMVWGQAGSGKSYFMEQTAKVFLRGNNDPNYRLVYIAPKGEGFESLMVDKQKPVYDMDNFMESVAKYRTTVYYPRMEGLEENVDEAVNTLFDMRDANPDMKVVVIIDDAQVFLSSRKAASNAHKRLALTGRSRCIKAVYVAHNIVFARELEGQIDLLVGFSNPNPLYYKQAIERFDFDPAPYQDAIGSRRYSFVVKDITARTTNLMAPIGSDGSAEEMVE
jgi:hypothetical protein